MDFWAVIGRVCSDASFHKEVFDRTGSVFPEDYYALESLKNFLCDEGFRLSREDVLMVNQIVKLAEVKGNVQIASPAKDAVITDVQTLYASAAPAGLIGWTLEEKVELWGVLGLACIDETFADDLQVSVKDDISHNATDKTTRMLVNGDRTVGESPRFRLKQNLQIPVVISIFSAPVPKIKALLLGFDMKKWEQPSTSIVLGGCSKGHARKHYQPTLEQLFAVVLADITDPVSQAFRASLTAKKFLKPEAALLNADIKSARVAEFMSEGKLSLFSP